MVIRLLVGGFLLAGILPAGADDIGLQVGRRFSVYAPASCLRLQQSGFAIFLDCYFRGKKAQFYLKEFPGELAPEFDPSKYPPAQVNEDAYRAAALKAVVGDLDPHMAARVTILTSGGNLGSDAETIVWAQGYLPGSVAPDGTAQAAKCVLLRVQTYRVGLAGALVALSDVDGVTQNGAPTCTGMPGEAPTILSSLAGNFESGRFIGPH
jgi:hypothetical protein